MEMVAFKGTQNEFQQCADVALPSIDDARFYALLGMLGLHKHHGIQQMTLPEARRKLIAAVNLWSTRAPQHARTYEFEKCGPKNAGRRVRQTVTVEDLRDDLEAFELMIEKATEAGASFIVWM